MKLKSSIVSLRIQDPNNISLREALIKHFAYSIEDISSYDELTPKEKEIISEDLFKEITYNEE